MQKLIGAIVVLAACPAVCFASKMSDHIQAAAASGKYAYVMFYRANDAATQNMASTIRSHVTTTQDRTTWVTVNVRDRQETQLVKRFDASRIPLPAVFGVAPNGAVTGVYRRTVNQQQLANAVLTPKYADMVKALQNQKIAVVCLLPSPGHSTPAGVEQFLRNPSFNGHLYRITAAATEQAEAEFFKRMQVSASITAPVVMLFAPPGTHLGTYDSNVTDATLAQTVHASGKCNCAKCQAKKQ